MQRLPDGSHKPNAPVCCFGCQRRRDCAARSCALFQRSMSSTRCAVPIWSSGQKEERQPFVLDIERRARKRLVNEIAVLKARVASRNIVDIGGRSKTRGRHRMPYDYTTETEE